MYIYIYIYGAFRRPLSACFLDEEHLANLESEMKRHCGQSKDKDETMFTPEKTKGPIKDHGHNVTRNHRRNVAVAPCFF